MPSLSPMDRFVNLIGGEQNLPPQLLPTPPAPAAGESPDVNDELSKLPSVEAVITEDALLQRAQAHNASLSASVREVVYPSIQPQFTPDIAQQPTFQTVNADLSIDPRRDEAAPLGISLTPFGAVTKFCYKFVKSEYQQPLATLLWDSNKIYQRNWDLWYVWSDLAPSAKPVIFVPESQVASLIDDCNRAYPNAKVGITDELRDEGMVVNFDSRRNDLRPKWLGNCTSRDQHDHWIANLPLPLQVKSPMAADRDLEGFKRHIEQALELGKAKRSAKIHRSQQAAMQRKQSASKQVLRAQRYLGLIAKKDEDDLMPDMAGLSIAAIDPSKPPPYPLDMDAIFISIDCEAYEKWPKVVTEVGVATLDTRDLQGNAPGSVGQNWHKHIRGRHFRIIEHKHLVNKEYCPGDPTAFEYGKSEFVGKDNIASALTGCFHEPFSKKQPDDSYTVTTKDANAVEEKRNIILLGHDINADIEFCKAIGFHPLNRGNMLDVLDSADLFRAYTKAVNPSSLGNVCYHFDLSAWHAHNAGNDAMHTVWALLAIAVKDASERGSEDVAKKHEENFAQKMEEAVELAKERVKSDAEGWGVHDDDDGGVAVAPREEDFASKKAKAKNPAFGPPRPPSPSASGGLYTSGGAPLDV
ncbi:hypothetical protein LTR36_009521 [Oleoguttula mirabilis]|uniref:Gfd2/YDR514C-like C-terminal domain-containing protein n=1 Tax=Oleoguttula mirabilis TaxID=1507867 RepID=A0AAV9JUD8_9PEZI|nr:hypothetical protein LTR36_009521 [Oleoguttula mirabilis]